MASAASDPFPDQAKIVIAGGFGAGKTTLVGSISEIRPLTTEEVITTASTGIDDLDGVEGKTTTTVALDFGRRTIPEQNLVLYLFGTPGQDRFWFMWDDLCRGTLGAVVLADTRRLEHCFAAVEFFENRRLPFVVAINQFDDAYRYDAADVRAALRLSAEVPLLLCDARDRQSVKRLLIDLVQYVIQRRAAAARNHSDLTRSPL
jgi:signal recognition particle receptor subunit beta